MKNWLIRATKPCFQILVNKAFFQNLDLLSILNGVGGHASAFQATSGPTNGFTTFGERKIENDGSSFDVAELSEFFVAGGNSLPDGVLIGGVTIGFVQDGIVSGKKLTLKSGKNHEFSPFKNYTAHNISAFLKGSGVFSPELTNQLHELAHSILRINGVFDATHTQDIEDTGEEFSDCVEKQYNILNKPKKKKRKKRGS